MMKDCVLLDGKVINIGKWDCQVQSIVVSPAEYAENGDLIKEAVVEERETNPLPAGAIVTELECLQNEDGGWYAVEYAPQLPDSLEAAVTELRALKKRTDDVESSIYAIMGMM